MIKINWSFRKIEKELLKTNKYYAYISKITNLQKNIADSLVFVKWKNDIKNDSVVFIKPNFTFPSYREGITTSPLVLKHLLEIITNRAKRVIVGESDGGNRSFSAQDAFKGHNMYEICKDVGVELVNLSELPSMNVEKKINGTLVRVEVPKILVEEVDCLISVPVLKVHVMTKVTLSMKNLWGCYPDAMRCLHHKNLSRKLTLLTKVLNPKLTIIDGIYGLDGHGPMFGTFKKLDLLLASNNIVVADSLGSNVMGISPRTVSHIKIAEKEGLGTTILDNVILNQDWQQFSNKFQINKTFTDYLSVFLFNSELLAKFVMDSPMTPFIYSLAKYLRNSDEERVANELKRCY